MSHEGAKGERKGRTPNSGAGGSFIAECLLRLWAPTCRGHAGDFGCEGPKVANSGGFHEQITHAKAGNSTKRGSCQNHASLSSLEWTVSYLRWIISDLEWISQVWIGPLGPKMHPLNPAPPGLFPHPRPPGGGVGSDPPCYLENQWPYRTPRGGVRKLSTSSSQSMLKILRLTLSFGSRSGQRSNFDVSVWWSPGPAISIAFARNSPKVTWKGYWRYPVSISVILSTGQGQGQVTKGHERSPNSKILFWACGTCFLGTFARRFQKSKPFCNLTPKSQRKRRVRSTLGSQKVKFSNRYFWIKNMCFWTSLISGFQKCHFYYSPMSRNGPNHSLKKWRHQRIRFFGYMFAKNRHIKLKFSMLYVQV